MASFIRTSDHLTIVFDDGVSVSVYASTPRYKEVVAALAKKDYNLARKIAIPVETIKTQIQEVLGVDAEKVVIEHGIVRFEGKEMDNTLTRRMLQMVEEGFDIKPLKLFLINLQNNPSYRAVNELYGFLEKGNLPITEDGHFLAYKKVRGDYKDVHTGKFDNSVGKIVEMKRNEVDEDSRNECSNGLHFCSKDYLGVFNGEHTMIVKINPADVVAIPADYNSSKGRCCRYEVIGELGKSEKFVTNTGELEGSFRDTGTYVDHDWSPEEDDDDYDYDYGTDDDVTDDRDEDFYQQDHVDEFNEALAAYESQPSSTKIVAICKDTESQFTFNSVKDAAVWAGITPSAINRVLKGDRKSAGGCAWISSEITIDPVKSSFAGLPANDSVEIPRGVAIEIAQDLDDEDEDEDDLGEW